MIGVVFAYVAYLSHVGVLPFLWLVFVGLLIDSHLHYLARRQD